MSSPSFSFELFPPRTPEGAAKLPGVICELAAARPDYFSVTYGAGGSNQDGTYETLLTVVKHCGIEAAPPRRRRGMARTAACEIVGTVDG